MDGVSNITRHGRGKKILVAFPFLHWFPRHTLTHSLPRSLVVLPCPPCTVCLWWRRLGGLRRCPTPGSQAASSVRQVSRRCTLLFPCCCGRPSTQRREAKLFELGSNLIQLIASVVYIYFAYLVFFYFLAKKSIGPFG